jgi:hypothetical protein
MPNKKVVKGNKVNWIKTKIDPGSQSFAVTTGVNKITLERMEHFGPKMVMMGWIGHTNKYAVARFALESYFAGLAREEAEGRF